MDAIEFGRGQVAKLVIEKVRISVEEQLTLSKMRHADWSIESYFDHETKALALRLVGKVLAICNDLPPEIAHVEVPEFAVPEIVAPADWWEHVKERFAPAWFLRRWPVRMRTLQAQQVMQRSFRFSLRQVIELTRGMKLPENSCPVEIPIAMEDPRQFLFRGGAVTRREEGRSPGDAAPGL